jgi:hypothetical protein
MKPLLRAACLLMGCGLMAQQGHPLTGTWSGDWGATATPRKHLTVVMNWDGTNVTGLINPGPDSIRLSTVSVDYAKWTVHIEASGKDRIVADGKLEDLGSYHRTITGTWSQGTAQSTTKGDFKLTRD